VYDWAQWPVVPTPKGERRDFFDGPSATFRNMECHATTLNAGEIAHEPHRHPDEEFILVKEGRLEATIDGVPHVAGVGSIFFFASNDLHGLRNVGEGRATYWVLRIVTDRP
jgi:uncharacterized cupin superfamily protein